MSIIRKMTLLKLGGAFLILVGASILLLGFSTYYWPSAEAWLTESRVSRLSPSGYSGVLRPTIRDNRYASYVDWARVEYSFSTDDGFHTNNLLCVCIPLNTTTELLKPQEWAKRVEIRYFPYTASVSVLIAGPDLFLSSLFFLPGMVLFFWSSLFRTRP